MLLVGWQKKPPACERTTITIPQSLPLGTGLNSRKLGQLNEKPSVCVHAAGYAMRTTTTR